MNFTEEYRKYCNVLDDDFFVVDHFPSNAYLLGHILACVLNVILTITTTLLNAATLVTFWKSSQLRGKVSFYLIQVQSVIDLGLGILCNAIYTFALVSEVTGTIQCELYFGVKRTVMLVTAFSLTTLSAMNFERYMGIVYPLIHRTKVTKRRLSLFIISMCALYLIMIASSFVYARPLQTFVTGIIVLFLLTTVYIYAKIYRVATKATHSDILQNDNASSHQTSAEKKRKQQFMKEITLAKSCFLVVVFSIICFVPPLLLGNLGLTGFDTLVYRTWAVTIAMVNPSLNSAIFFWKNRKLRDEAKKVLKKYWNGLFKRQTRIREPSITQISNVVVTP